MKWLDFQRTFSGEALRRRTSVKEVFLKGEEGLPMWTSARRERIEER